MIYSDLYTEQKQKIPTILGIFVIIFMIFFFFSLTSRSAMPSKANQIGIKRIEVTNLSPIQINIYWQTQEKETGWIIFGDKQEKLTNIAFDNRDIEEKKGNYLNHFVTLKNLKPGSFYYYAIISNNKKVVKPDGNYFMFKTPQTSSFLTKLSPASGKILQSNLLPLSNAVVFITVKDETIPISTLTKESGEWLIPLNSFYDKNSQTEKMYTGKEQAKVEVLSEDGKISVVINSLEGLSSNFETIIIGKNYNFLENNNVLSAMTDFSDGLNSQPIQIIYPQEGSLIPGKKPLIKGIALPLTEINITINSKKTFSAIIKSDKAGNWNYLIPENLDLGDHKITVKTKGIDGQDVILVRSFKIIANDGLEGKVLGMASGEPTITVIPTLIPTNYVYTTPINVISPTVVQLKKAGGVSIFPIFGGLSLIIVGGGILLAF